MRKSWSIISISNNLFWLLVVCGLLFFAITFNIKVGWFLIYFFSMVLLCSLLSLGRRFRRYQVAIAPLIQLNRGEQESVLLKLTEKSGKQLRLPPHISGSLELPHDQFELKMEKSRDQRLLTLTAQIDEEVERGIYQSVQVNFVSKDVFNLLRQTHRFYLETSLLVLPERQLKECRDLMALLNRQKRLPLAVNYMRNQDVKALRDYREGDQLNQIDWKLSAKREHLVVKEFESEPQEELLILFYGNDGHYFEKMLSLFYTMEYSESEHLKRPNFLIYDPSQEAFQLATAVNYAQSQPLHMEKELIRSVRHLHLHKTRVIMLTARYSRDVIGLGEELAENNELIIFYYNRQGKLAYEIF
ncbi:DUF58 domain-containing protein [Vagococcus sp. BWB3-3]|uniref:DUF58 domain-containing protein n=1 Tax=Vagococcus allomyrinae TaxID=2794353 RepID=A0A940SYZ3_9ENTE|nr:DUF58 domain-containing protein [Vagococcus allomyrinae]MBP1043903.1 DUF58 domain-containing protein [Vagococcus allomyrinae]